MDKDQITSNLGELIKNQIEICEKLDKIAKRIKKIGKPKKEPNYELKGGVFAKGADSKSPFVCAGESIISKKQSDQLTPKQDQKYYLCIKPFGLFKEGLILKYKHYCSLLNDHFYNCINGVYGIYLKDIKREPEYFIPIQQFETLKEGQDIEFTLRNGKAYKCTVKWAGGFYLNNGVENIESFKDLNQVDFLHSLYAKYKIIRAGWPESPTLEDLTNDINKLITLPDLSKEVKIDKDVELEKQANELIDKFMPLVNGWKTVDGMGYIGQDSKQWIYNTWCQRQAAIKCAIVHCELMSKEFETRKYLLTELKQIDLVHLKSQLQKMLSE